MKLALAIVAFAFSTIALADNVCEVSSFGQVITGTGRSANAAMVDARIKCIQAGNSEMFCGFNKMACSTQSQRPQAYCEIVAFSDFYYSIQSSHQLAAEAVRKDCLAKQSSMFCAPEKVKCLDL